MERKLIALVVVVLVLGLGGVSYVIYTQIHSPKIDDGSFTRFEKLEFTSAYAESSGGNYLIHMTIKNTGSASATIDSSTIFYNGSPATAYGTYAPTTTFGTLTLDAGNSTTLIITLPDGADSPWVSSMNIEVMIQTVAGRQYPKVIILP
jgi:hypothetical protein